MKTEEIEKFALLKLEEFLARPVSNEDLDMDYASLGADSMDVIVLTFELEERLGVEIDPEFFFQYDNLRQALTAALELQPASGG